MAWTQEVFKQGTEIQKVNANWGKEKLNPGGVCFSLLVFWVKYHSDNPGSDAAGRMKAIRHQETMLRAGARQSMYSDIFKDNARHSGFEQTQAFSGILKYHGLKVGKINQGFLDSPTYACANLVNDVNQPRKYMYLSIKADKGGHAIGVYKNHGGAFESGKGFRLSHDLVVFDPNFGEFTISPDSTSDFFKVLFKTYVKLGIRFDRYYLYTLDRTTTSAQDLSKALFGIAQTHQVPV